MINIKDLNFQDTVFEAEWNKDDNGRTALLRGNKQTIIEVVDDDDYCQLYIRFKSTSDSSKKFDELFHAVEQLTAKDESPNE